MKFTAEEHNGVQVVHIEGKIMGGREDDALNDLKATYTNQEISKVVFDLEKVDWINSLGIGLFISFLSTMRNRGGDLRLANVPKSVYSLIDKCRMTTLLQSYKSVDDAVKSFK